MIGRQNLIAIRPNYSLVRESVPDGKVMKLWTLEILNRAYILKGGICGHRIPQTIWNFRRKIVWERKKYQDYTVCKANWLSFPLLMFSHCNKLSIKTLKHTIFSMKIPHWHQILVIIMIYALLSVNFTHFFRRFLETEKWNPQTFSLLECMPEWV